MKKNIFKFGAALTAAMMVFSASACLAFADEIEVPAEPETAVSDAIEAPADEAEAPAEDTEAPADEAEAEAPAQEVVIPLDTKEVAPEEIEAAEEVEAAADVDTNSVIKIGEITATKDSNFYTVKVPFTVDNAPDQMSFFVYDITGIANGNNQTAFESTTKVGYINQYAGAATGTYEFKLAKGTDYTDSSVLVVKIGGTGVDTPDAKSYSLANAVEGGDVQYGNVNGDDDINAADAILIMKYKAGKADLTADQQKAANVNGDEDINAADAILIMKYKAGKIDSFPVEQ